MASRAPCSASLRAIPRPMPRELPVISAYLGLIAMSASLYCAPAWVPVRPNYALDASSPSGGTRSSAGSAIMETL
jgi:hypothetical protein